jgi:uncharacterized protein (TIGR01589 family)
MAGGSSSRNNVQLVHLMVEHCLSYNVSQDEAVRLLQAEAGVEPDLTRLVWSKLEEDNPHFFDAYSSRLTLLKQALDANALMQRLLHLQQQQEQEHEQQQSRQFASPAPPPALDDVQPPAKTESDASSPFALGRQSSGVPPQPPDPMLQQQQDDVADAGVPRVPSGSDLLNVDLAEPSFLPDGASAPTESLTRAHSRPSLTALDLPSIG